MLTAVLAGCGAMSKAWLNAASQIADLRIVGLVDLDIERASSRAEEFGLQQASLGRDLFSILHETKPDMVFDVALPQVRLELVRTALSFGAHVLTEKPMATSLADAKLMIKLAQDTDRLHAVVQNRRYLAAVRRIRRFLDGGALGPVTSVHCDFFIAPHFGGFREEMDHVLLLDMSIHTFDAARYICNAEARSVFCKEWEPAGSWYRNGSSAIAAFELSTGAMFTYRGSWSAKGFKTSWESQWRIVCERGSLVWDGFDSIKAEVETGEHNDIFDVMAAIEVPALDSRDSVGGHVGVIRDFMKAIRDGSTPETNGWDNIRSLAMVFGAIESSETGRPVSIAD